MRPRLIGVAVREGTQGRYPDWLWLSGAFPRRNAAHIRNINQNASVLTQEHDFWKVDVLPDHWGFKKRSSYDFDSAWVALYKESKERKSRRRKSYRKKKRKRMGDKQKKKVLFKSDMLVGQWRISTTGFALRINPSNSGHIFVRGRLKRRLSRESVVLSPGSAQANVAFHPPPLLSVQNLLKCKTAKHLIVLGCRWSCGPNNLQMA